MRSIKLSFLLLAITFTSFAQPDTSSQEKRIKGRVPTPHGNIEVYADKKIMKIRSVEGEGLLRFHSKKPPVTEKGVEVKKLGSDYFEIVLNAPYKEYIIRYF